MSCPAAPSNAEVTADGIYYFTISSEWTYWLDALAFCPAGEWLAEFRNEDQFDAWEKHGTNIYRVCWMGLANPNMVNCDDTTCTGQLKWLSDGSAYVHDDFGGKVDRIQGKNDEDQCMKGRPFYDQVRPDGCKENK